MSLKPLWLREVLARNTIGYAKPKIKILSCIIVYDKKCNNYETRLALKITPWEGLRLNFLSISRFEHFQAFH